MKQKLTYEELIQFIMDHFDSYAELNSVVTKYNNGVRLVSLPEINWVFKNNLTTINTIAGEINAGKLNIFGDKMTEEDLKFWVTAYYPTQDALEGLIDLYTSGGHLEDIHQDLIVKNNFDAIVNLYQTLYFIEESDNNVVDQIEDTQNKLEEVADINMKRYDNNTFSVELFNEEEINMRKYNSFSDIPTQTEYLDVLQATIQQASINSKEMHWSVKGPGFKGVHELLGEMYDKFEDYLDELIETRFSNNDSFDYHISSFLFNSIIPDYDNGCPIEGSLNMIDAILQLLLANQDDLYADMIGRMTTDMNHYKFMFNGYKEAKDAGTLTDDMVIVEPTPEVDVLVNEESMENTVPTELAVIKGFCSNKRQAKCFNELVKTFASRGIDPDTIGVYGEANGMLIQDKSNRSKGLIIWSPNYFNLFDPSPNGIAWKSKEAMKRLKYDTDYKYIKALTVSLNKKNVIKLLGSENVSKSDGYKVAYEELISKLKDVGKSKGITNISIRKV